MGTRPAGPRATSVGGGRQSKTTALTLDLLGPSIPAKSSREVEGGHCPQALGLAKANIPPTPQEGTAEGRLRRSGALGPGGGERVLWGPWSSSYASQALYNGCLASTVLPLRPSRLGGFQIYASICSLGPGVLWLLLETLSTSGLERPLLTCPPTAEASMPHVYSQTQALPIWSYG